MDFITLIEQLTAFVVRVGQTVNDMPGTLAFGLGLFTWFAVEQILRRVMTGLRWLILIGALAALGLSLPQLVRLMGAPPAAPAISVPNS